MFKVWVVYEDSEGDWESTHSVVHLVFKHKRAADRACARLSTAHPKRWFYVEPEKVSERKT